MSTRAALMRTQALSAAFNCPVSADAVPTDNKVAIIAIAKLHALLPPIDMKNCYLISVFRKRYVKFIEVMINYDRV